MEKMSLVTLTLMPVPVGRATTGLMATKAANEAIMHVSTSCIARRTGFKQGDIASTSLLNGGCSLRLSANDHGLHAAQVYHVASNAAGADGTHYAAQHTSCS